MPLEKFFSNRTQTMKLNDNMKHT